MYGHAEKYAADDLQVDVTCDVVQVHGTSIHTMRAETEEEARPEIDDNLSPKPTARPFCRTGSREVARSASFGRA